MATLAAIFRRPAAARDLGACWTERQPETYTLRPLPCEDVYFYSKRIDNSRIVRQADPLAGRRCVRAVSMSLAVAMAIILLILPDTLTLIAGYQVHSLERERQALVNQKAMLDVEEARLVTPERLEQLARDLRLENPDPAHVVFLNAKSDTALALNNVSRHK
jgi:cell division protein FtsL